mmetsp:Transcript_107904/g.348345  ORF Transcript_107904/g.348345 Transcript_107904/m.348345 type:complete len:118 (+) Transcript_107904:1574-1927(+)
MHISSCIIDGFTHTVTGTLNIGQPGQNYRLFCNSLGIPVLNLSLCLGDSVNNEFAHTVAGTVVLNQLGHTSNLSMHISSCIIDGFTHTVTGTLNIGQPGQNYRLFCNSLGIPVLNLR